MKLKEALKQGAPGSAIPYTIHEGIFARKPVPFSLQPGPLPLGELSESGQWVYPETPGVILVDVRPLTSLEEIQALAQARTFAKAQGVDEPKEGQPIYDRAVMAHVVAVGAVDHASPKDAPEPFATVDELWQLDGDRIAMLYEQQVQWQSETSPRRGRLTHDEFMATVAALAGGDDGPFDRLPLATQRECLRTTARLLFASLTPSKPTTSGSSDEPTGTKSEPESNASPASGETS